MLTIADEINGAYISRWSARKCEGLDYSPKSRSYACPEQHGKRCGAEHLRSNTCPNDCPKVFQRNK